MTYINEHYLKLTAGYLFPEIGRRVQVFCDANPAANVIRLGIGDVTEPLAPAVIQAMRTAVDELAERSSFRGYGPEQGYDFLRVAIAEHDYQARGAKVDADEIFVSDAAWRVIEARYPADPVAQYYLSSIAVFVATPPPPDWDGTESMTEK